jgi:hypothetical protein
MPKRIGDCLLTNIKKVETRLIDGSTGVAIPNSGSAVDIENGAIKSLTGARLA